MNICLEPDKKELELYDTVRRYHGFFEQIGREAHVKPASLRQAINPNYHDRRSFITRTRDVFKGWIKQHPRSGRQALADFIRDIMDASDGATRDWLQAVIDDLETIKRRVEDAQHALDDARGNTRR